MIKVIGRVMVCMVLSFVFTASALAEEKKAAILFYGKLHSDYVVKPLVKMGFAVDSCKRGELSAKLASRKYNVVVVGEIMPDRKTLNDNDRKTLDAFMTQGGGVFVCNSEPFPDEKNFTATSKWLTSLGARPRWEQLKDIDSNIVVDAMKCRLSKSNKIYPPVNKDCRQVLTLLWQSTTGIVPPMSFDFSKKWKIVLRGAASMSSEPSPRNDVHISPWVPEKGVKSAPPLLAIRDIGSGRMAVNCFSYSWIFAPPKNCPTSKNMLTGGVNGTPSDWLRVIANTFEWLGEPSLKAGMGGAKTPSDLLNPPVKIWEIPAKRKSLADLAYKKTSSFPGLIGAQTSLSSGSGSVREYVDAAKKSGLKFIVFLENSLKMNQKKWDQLAKECNELSDKNFAAVPGLTYEDAQGNHLYAFADEAMLPKSEMLFADKRLKTVQGFRTRAYFDYTNELMRQKVIAGFWNHKKNYLHFADYKIYNSFPVYSFLNGRQIDNALDEYLYLTGIGGCQAVLAFEMMTDPEQVAKRAKNGWRVVSFRPPEVIRKKWHNGAWSFSGGSSQYITNGPEIVDWEMPGRGSAPHGLWWRQDLWQMVLKFKVRSEKGLKLVTIYNGDKEIFRQWKPNGKKEFEQQIVMTNCQQRGLVLVVEDIAGKKAVSMAFYNRNLIKEEFICSDRCNFLGNSRLRSKSGEQRWTQVGFKANMGVTPSKGLMDMSVAPAVGLTENSPTLPIDGQPAGFPTCILNFHPMINGELPYIFSYPSLHVIGPEIGIGQGNYILGYTTDKKSLQETPLGHKYIQPQTPWGNAWGSWHKLIPLKKISGWSRTYACNWIPGTFRIGWHETSLTIKAPVELKKQRFQIMHASLPGWKLYHGNEPLSLVKGELLTGVFAKGTYAVLEHSGGSLVLLPLAGELEYEISSKGAISLYCKMGKDILKKGEKINYQVGFAGAPGGTAINKLLAFADKFGVAIPGTVAYNPILSQGKQIDNDLIWKIDGEKSGISAKIPKTDLPAFLPVMVENLNSNWSTFLLEKTGKKQQFRGVPVKDSRAYAQLDLNDSDKTIFIGHPITGDNPDVVLQTAWKSDTEWFIEAHNPTEKTITVKIKSNPDWNIFTFNKTVELQPGSSQNWDVKIK